MQEFLFDPSFATARGFARGFIVLVLLGALLVFLIQKNLREKPEQLGSVIEAEALTNLLIFGLALVLGVLVLATLPDIWGIFRHLTSEIRIYLEDPTGTSGKIETDTFRLYALAFVGIVGVLGAFVGYGFSVLRAVFNTRQTRATEQGQITERLTKAIEQLGKDKVVESIDEKDNQTKRTEPNIEVRIGALFALERIAQDSLRDHIHIMEILCAYVRQNTMGPRIDHAATKDAEAAKRNALKKKSLTKAEKEACIEYADPREDVQTALTILGRRGAQGLAKEAKGVNGKPYCLDLRGAHIHRADLSGQNFERANLGGARLEGANLVGVQLEEAILVQANLQEADLENAQLQRAWLELANLKGARLFEANMQKCKLGLAQLSNAGLGGAQMQRANLSSAQLIDAYLNNAHLEGAYLRDAQLKRALLDKTQFDSRTFLQDANLQGALMMEVDLSMTKISQTQIDDDVFGHKSVKLPDGITRPKAWAKNPDDNAEFYAAWLATPLYKKYQED